MADKNKRSGVPHSFIGLVIGMVVTLLFIMAYRVKNINDNIQIITDRIDLIHPAPDTTAIDSTMFYEGNK